MIQSTAIRGHPEKLKKHEVLVIATDRFAYIELLINSDKKKETTLWKGIATEKLSMFVVFKTCNLNALKHINTFICITSLCMRDQHSS